MRRGTVKSWKECAWDNVQGRLLTSASGSFHMKSRLELCQPGAGHPVL